MERVVPCFVADRLKRSPRSSPFAVYHVLSLSPSLSLQAAPELLVRPSLAPRPRLRWAVISNGRGRAESVATCCRFIPLSAPLLSGISSSPCRVTCNLFRLHFARSLARPICRLCLPDQTRSPSCQRPHWIGGVKSERVDEIPSGFWTLRKKQAHKPNRIAMRVHSIHLPFQRRRRSTNYYSARDVQAFIFYFCDRWRRRQTASCSFLTAAKTLRFV